MVDAVTTQIIEQGPRNAIIKFTNISDGTGETDVLKVDVSTLSGDPLNGGAPTSVSIEKIWYDISGMQVLMEWDATVDVPAAIISSGQFELDFTSFRGIDNNAGAGKTGDILFTTLGANAGDTYLIILKLVKEYS